MGASKLSGHVEHGNQDVFTQLMNLIAQATERIPNIPNNLTGLINRGSS
jgi:hypothetical protein